MPTEAQSGAGSVRGLALLGFTLDTEDRCPADSMLGRNLHDAHTGVQSWRSSRAQACGLTPTAGRAKIETPGRTDEVSPGTVIFVPTGEEHRFTEVAEDLVPLVAFGPAYGSHSPKS